MNPLLADSQPRYRAFGVSALIQSLLVLTIILAPLLLPESLQAVRKYRVTMIEVRPVEAWKPQPQPKMRVRYATPAPVLVVPHKILTPKNPPSALVVRHREKVAAPDLAGSPEPGTLPSLGSSAIPTLKKPREEVQTGGFGDPNGVPINGKVSQSPNIAMKGAFDMPAGPGNGNGTGGASGAKGVVESAGFGNSVASASGNGSGSRREVAASGFSDQATPTPMAKPISVAPSFIPVKITFKPKPVYSLEARDLHIEGDCSLEVNFRKDGTLAVIRVVNSLGHGLDETATAAAQGIRFVAARSNDLPVDTIAIVKIRYELAQ